MASVAHQVPVLDGRIGNSVQIRNVPNAVRLMFAASGCRFATRPLTHPVGKAAAFR